MNDLKDIQIRYSRMSDFEIIQLAKNPKGLRSEVIPILEKEIITRKLILDIKWITDENNEFASRELEDLKKRISNLKCSNCNQKSEIQGFEFRRVISYIFFTDYVLRKVFLCKKCGHKIRLRNLLYNVLLGWWSGSGLWMTPYSLYYEFYFLIFPRKEDEIIVMEFIEKNTGKLRRTLNEDELENIINNYDLRYNKFS